MHALLPLVAAMRRIPLALDCGHGCPPIHLSIPVDVTSTPGSPAVLQVSVSEEGLERVRRAALVHMVANHE